MKVLNKVSFALELAEACVTLGERTIKKQRMKKEQY
jgi:hypothetical protein